MSDETTDDVLKDILGRTKVIASVGVSTNPVRPSYFVARYLSYRGYRVIPINPVAAGEVIFGETVLESLSDIPGDVTVDMVDIFRRPDFIPEIYEAAAAHLMPGLNTLWMQFGISHPEVAAKARAAGLTVVEDRCPKVEYQRLYGELRKAGMNTGIITSKRRAWV